MSMDVVLYENFNFIWIRPMTNSTNDPDLNLQAFNDHGIFTLEGLNELSNVVKAYFSAVHLNIWAGLFESWLTVTQG